MIRHADTMQFIRGAFLALLVLGAGACEESSLDSRTTPVAVLSAFPAELAAILEHTNVENWQEIDGRIFRVGTIGATPVVVAMTGIGLANADITSRLALERFGVGGFVFSGVAGSYLNIADVAVPMTWRLTDGTSYESDPTWLALAEQVAAPGVVALERCTVPATMPTADPVCMPNEPKIVVGGVGQSEGFAETPAPCQPGGGDVFGCDVEGGTGTGGSPLEFHAPDGEAEGEPLAAADMESAAVARVAAQHGLPFIAFRAVSDGPGDPLNLPGFPAQFFAYYRLASHNAAAAAAAFVELL